LEREIGKNLKKVCVGLIRMTFPIKVARVDHSKCCLSGAGCGCNEVKVPGGGCGGCCHSDKKDDCKKCVVCCPVEAVKIEDKKVIIDEKLCIGCGECVRICCNSAISMKRVM